MPKHYSMIMSEFYCMKCGNKGIPIARKKGCERKSLHKKKLYCIHCKEEVNHVECKSEKDVKEFKKSFEKGEFKDEVQAYVCDSRNSWVWKDNIL